MSDESKKEPGSVWIYNKHSVTLPSSVFAVTVKYGDAAGRPTPVENLVAGLTCRECGGLFGGCDGHAFVEPEESPDSSPLLPEVETPAYTRIVLTGTFTTKIEDF